jgi:hypothetical protein
VIDILTNEDMENMSLCISQYLTLYYIIKSTVITQTDNIHAKITYRCDWGKEQDLRPNWHLTPCIDFTV